MTENLSVADRIKLIESRNYEFKPFGRRRSLSLPDVNRNINSPRALTPQPPKHKKPEKPPKPPKPSKPAYSPQNKTQMKRPKIPPPVPPLSFHSKAFSDEDPIDEPFYPRAPLKPVELKYSDISTITQNSTSTNVFSCNTTSSKTSTLTVSTNLNDSNFYISSTSHLTVSNIQQSSSSSSTSSKKPSLTNDIIKEMHFNPNGKPEFLESAGAFKEISDIVLSRVKTGVKIQKLGKFIIGHFSNDRIRGASDYQVKQFDLYIKSDFQLLIQQIEPINNQLDTFLKRVLNKPFTEDGTIQIGSNLQKHCQFMVDQTKGNYLKTVTSLFSPSASVQHAILKNNKRINNHNVTIDHYLELRFGEKNWKDIYRSALVYANGSNKIEGTSPNFNTLICNVFLLYDISIKAVLQTYVKKMKKCLEGYEVDLVKIKFVEELALIEKFCLDCLEGPAKTLDEECSRTWFSTYLQAYPDCQSIMANNGIHKISYVVKSCSLRTKTDLENILVIIKNDEINANGTKYFILIDSKEDYGKNRLPFIFAELGKGSNVWLEGKWLNINGLEPVKLKIDNAKKGSFLTTPLFMKERAGFFNRQNNASTTSSNSPYNLENYKFLSRVGKKAQKNGQIGWNYSCVEIKFDDDNDLIKTIEVLRNFHEKNVDRSKSGYNH